MQSDLQQVKEEDAKKRDELQDLLAAVTIQVQQVTNLKEKVNDGGDSFQSDETYVIPSVGISDQSLILYSIRRRFESLVEQFDMREICHANLLLMLYNIRD